MTPPRVRRPVTVPADLLTATRTLLLGADAEGKDMIAPSYEPAAAYHNRENLSFEAVWPFDLRRILGADRAAT